MGIQLDVIRLVAKELDVPLESMIVPRDGKRRGERAVKARYLAALILRENFRGISLSDIGELLGNMDHTTVLHGIRRMRAIVGSDQESAALYKYAAQRSRDFVTKRLAQIA